MSKNLYKQVEELEEKSAGPEPTPTPAPVETPKEKQEEAPSPTPAPTDTPEEEKLDASAFAKLRMEAAAAKRKQKELEDELAKRSAAPSPTPAPTPAPTNVDVEPDKANDYEGWMEWNIKQMKRQNEELAQKLRSTEEWRQQEETNRQREQSKVAAQKAFLEYEADFKKTVKDYDHVAQHLGATIAHSFKMLNPQATTMQVQEAVIDHIMHLSAQATRAGYNPVEWLYHNAKSNMGYQPPQEEAPKDEEKKADLKTIIKNKEKAVSSAVPGGKGGNQPMSKSALLSGKMSVGEWSRLDPNKIRELEG